MKGSRWALECVSRWTAEEYDEEWGKKIQTEKFRWYNGQWLEMVENRQMDEGEPFLFGEDAESFIGNGDILERPDLFYSPDGIITADGALSPEFYTDFQSGELGQTGFMSSVSEQFVAADRPVSAYGFHPDDPFFYNYSTASR